MPLHQQMEAPPYFSLSLDIIGKTQQARLFFPILNSALCRGLVKIMLELGSIDMNVIQAFTGNTPLLMLLKVIEKDGPEELEVAGESALAVAHSHFLDPLILLQRPSLRRGPICLHVIERATMACALS